MDVLIYQFHSPVNPVNIVSSITHDVRTVCSDIYHRIPTPIQNSVLAISSLIVLETKIAYCVGLVILNPLLSLASPSRGFSNYLEMRELIPSYFRQVGESAGNLKKSVGDLMYSAIPHATDRRSIRVLKVGVLTALVTFISCHIIASDMMSGYPRRTASILNYLGLPLAWMRQNALFISIITGIGSALYYSKRDQQPPIGPF